LELYLLDQDQDLDQGVGVADLEVEAVQELDQVLDHDQEEGQGPQVGAASGLEVKAV